MKYSYPILALFSICNLLADRGMLAQVSSNSGSITGISDQYNTGQPVAKAIPGKDSPSSSPVLSVAEELNGSGLCFTPNKGQIADMNGKLCPDVLYKGSSAGADIYLRKNGISYVYNNLNKIMHEVGEQIEYLEKTGSLAQISLQEKKQELMQKQTLQIYRVDMDFTEANKNPNTINENEVEGYINYYYANCPKGITNVTQYNKVTYKNIYNNIDLTYYGDKENGIKYDLIVQPHADPNQIKLHWKGAESIHLNGAGHLIIKTSVNEFAESIPKVYQILNGEIIDVKAKYKLTSLSASGGRAGEGLVSFELGTWNRELPLIIDPWATYYGGSTSDFSTGIATDKSGNVVLTGFANSIDLPVTTGAFQTMPGSNGDSYVVKFNSAGNRLWASYYGGRCSDQARSIATDTGGNVIITGYTCSSDLPVSGGTQMVYGGGNNDVFIAKFTPTGTLIWASFYGGSNWDIGWGVAADNSGNIFVTGWSSSLNFPSLSGYQMAFAGGPYDAIVIKFNPAGVPIWATYYGGNEYDFGNGIATDASGNVVITGSTRSVNFPVLSGHQMALGSTTNYDAFAVKFNSAGTRLWATFYGGASDENSFNMGRIATDISGNVIITGQTGSANFPVTAGASQTLNGGGVGGDIFIVKFNPAGVRLWSTYYGSNEGEWWPIVATDNGSYIYIMTEAEEVVTPNLVDACTYQPTFGGVEDQLIAKFSPSGKKLCTTYMGGTGEDDLDGSCEGIAIYGNSLYISGCTNGGYPVTPGAFQTIYTGTPGGSISGGSGGSAAFVASLCTNICEGKVVGLNFTASTTISACVPVTFTPSITNACDTTGYKFQWIFAGGSPATSTNVKPTVIFPGVGTHDVKLIVTTICKKDSITKPAYITTTNCTCVMTAAASVITNASCSGTSNGSANVTINSGSGGTYSYSWSNGINGTTTAAGIMITGLSANTYTVTITDGSCISVSTVTVSSQNTVNINLITAGNISCNGGSNGSATVTISSSLSGPYTYKWSNGASSITNSLNNSIANLTAGTYTVSITQGSCISTSTVTITEPQLLVIGGSTQYSCLTNSGSTNTFSVNGTPPYSYLWNNGQTTQNATGLNLGTTYTVTATDAGGCTATKTFIPVISPMVITTTSTNNSCATTGSASVTVTSGVPAYSYSWSTGQTSPSVGGLVAGGYSVTITDGNGCAQTNTFSITGVNPVSATFTNPPACINQQVCFTNTGSTGTYSWTIGPPANVSGTTANFCTTFLTAGTYSISHTITNAGCTGNVTQNITVTNCSGPTITATGSSVCPGSCATITSNGSGGTAPYIYSWSNGSTTQNISACPLSTTTYTVTIKDSGGNTATSTAIVSINPIVNISLTATNITCNGNTNGSAIANAGSGTPPYNYSWNNGQTTQTATGLSAGNYTLTITDSKNCTAANTVTIISPPVLSGQFTKGTANCAACGCKEWIIITANGGTSPYSYSWPDGYVNRYKNQLCPGNYTVNIKDKNGCSINISLITP